MLNKLGIEETLHHSEPLDNIHHIEVVEYLGWYAVRLIITNSNEIKTFKEFSSLGKALVYVKEFDTIVYKVY